MPASSEVPAAEIFPAGGSSYSLINQDNSIQIAQFSKALQI